MRKVAMDPAGSMDGMGAYKWDGGRDPDMKKTVTGWGGHVSRWRVE